MENTLRNISNYIYNYFQDNYGSLENFYKNYEVKNNKKGIYYLNSQKTSIEEKSVELFFEYLGKPPISQNILLINKDTSYEELESFLYRAILCKYNSLFIIGLNNLISSQEDSLLRIINDLIKFIKKRDKMNSNNENEIDIKSCIIFIYNENQNNNKFIQQIKNINKESKFNRELIYERENKNINEIKNENIIVYLSNLNGTGKTFAIREDIDKKGLTYKYFPFGGFLNKSIIYNKIKKLLYELKKEDNKDNKQIGIHLDLYETEQQNLMNDFLFSFLFTKYYKKDENVIYIPSDFYIYIEIPNCFISFINTYPILNSFKSVEINIENPRTLKLEEEEKEKLKLLNIENIEEYIKEKIGIKRPSYYQKRQFINSLLSQITPINIQYLNKEIIDKIIESTKHFTINAYSNLLKEETNKELTEEKILDLLTSIDEGYKDNETNLIFFNKKINKFYEIETKKESYKDCNKLQFLDKFKDIFNLDNPINKSERNNNNLKLKTLEEIIGKEYVITSDNFIKMVKIYYIINSNLNLIIMGETGCGKTLLISKLYELLNNGEKMTNDYKINIHEGFTDKDIIEKVIEIDKKADKITRKNRNKKIWVFIDEINSCKSMGLFNEIICNHSCNGKKLNRNLVFIGACNPYRKSKIKQKVNGINKEIKQNKILYNVYSLSLSLMNFVFYFGSLKEEDEKKYIESIIEDLFNENETELKEISKEIIFIGHKKIREIGDVSSVSLRELNKFRKCFNFFIEYYKNKKSVLNSEQINNEKLNDEGIIKRKCIILSLFVCYYMKISDPKNRSEFETLIKSKLNKEDNNKKEDKDSDNLIMGLIGKDEKFSNILNLEENFIISQIELESGIAENRPLRDNIFMLFIAINMNIPIFIIGKPGSSKTLSVNLIDKAMQGKYSKSNFFRKYPKLIKIWFQGSENTSTHQVEKLFSFAEEKVKSIKNIEFYGQHPITYIFFDEIGLCEISEKKPLKVLNFKFEYENKEDYLSFVGISNWSLDAAKMNRGFFISVPELYELDEDAEETCQKIVKNIDSNLWEENSKNIFIPLYKAYIEYKKLLINKYKIDEAKNPLCHGNRDFYFLIKNVSYNMLKQKKDNKNINALEIVKLAIERNFDSLHLENEESCEIFKKLFINNCENKEMEVEFKNSKKDVINNIISNIIDKKSRNLLLITRTSLNILLVDTIKEKLKQLYNEKKINKIEPIYKIGSSFEDDKGEEYKIKIINQIKEHAKNGDVLFLEKISKILPFLFELFNMNYFKKDGKNYSRISIGKLREQFIEVNDNFKVILLFDKEEIKTISQPTASRFEKIEVDFSNLLEKEEIKRAENISNIFNQLTKLKLKDKKKLNYDLNNLIVNLDLEEIQSMVYYCKNDKSLIGDEKKYIFEKIIPALPQDIIGCFLFNELIENNNDNDIKEMKSIYNKIEKNNNITDLLNDNKNIKYKFSIIYTFSNLSEQFTIND